ncbi:MAG: glycosyltransferase [Desulfobacterales bacterium]|jgi:glycosyltransferase involved in cell wall biosynthesis
MTVRIDLHVHSKFSSRPSQWILQKVGCPESFTEPLSLYRIAKLRGMSHVTITDHNRIEGALEIAHLADTFVSEEVTTYFPEDRCKIHVLALNITEAQHRDIHAVRENIYELADYLIESGILHIVAHPLYSVNGRLTIAHFEKLLLLFKNFEMNGARNDAANDALKHILGQLTPAKIDRLAEMHAMHPRIPNPWQKNLTGGSDDHSALNIARTFTEIPGTDSLETALKAICSSRAEVIRRPSSPLTFAHNLYGIAYQYYRNKLDLERYAGSDTLLDFIDHCLQPGPVRHNRKFMSKLYCLWHYRKRPRLQSHVPETLADLVRQESGRLLYDNPQLMEIARTGATSDGELEEKWFEFVNQTSARMALNIARHLMSHLAGANVFNTFQTIGEAGGLYAMLAPYLISFTYFSQDRVFSEKIVAHFRSRDRAHQSAAPGAEDRVVAHFTDRMTSLRPLIRTLDSKAADLLHGPGKMTILACGEPFGLTDTRLCICQPVGVYEHAGIAGHKLLFPPFMEMLNHCFSEHVTHIHSATPGPVGLAALGVARILKLPVYGTFHQAPHEVKPFMGEDESAAEMLQRFMSWYYDQLDRIYVFSEEGRDRLTRQGVAAQKITVVPQAIDIHRFHPLRGERRAVSRRRNDERIDLVYAGPLTHENNLALLAETFKILSSHKKNLHLVLVGNGPYQARMKRLLTGYPCTFHDRLSVLERAEVYAGGALLVCPGADTDGGRPLLEAQACGLPLVVTDHENHSGFVSPGHTGLVVEHNDATRLYEALLRMVDDPAMRARMGACARRHAESLAIDAAALGASEPKITPVSSDLYPQLAEAV